jgi:hypothetical protein
LSKSVFSGGLAKGFTVGKIISDKFVKAGDNLNISIIITTTEAEKSNQIKSI